MDENFEESEEMWPFEIDVKVSSYLEELVPGESLARYHQLQEMVFESLMNIDSENYMFCEVFLSKAFMDLLYFSALLVCEEHPELKKIASKIFNILFALE